MQSVVTQIPRRRNGKSQTKLPWTSGTSGTCNLMIPSLTGLGRTDDQILGYMSQASLTVQWWLYEYRSHPMCWMLLFRLRVVTTISSWKPPPIRHTFANRRLWVWVQSLFLVSSAAVPSGVASFVQLVNTAVSVIAWLSPNISKIDREIPTSNHSIFLSITSRSLAMRILLFRPIPVFSCSAHNFSWFVVSTHLNNIQLGWWHFQDMEK